MGGDAEQAAHPNRRRRGSGSGLPGEVGSSDGDADDDR